MDGSPRKCDTMKRILSRAEIAFWDTAISLMSQSKTPRVYSQTVATMTLRLQSFVPSVVGAASPELHKIRLRPGARLALISGLSLLIGLLLGWLRST